MYQLLSDVGWVPVFIILCVTRCVKGTQRTLWQNLLFTQLHLWISWTSKEKCTKRLQHSVSFFFIGINNYTWAEPYGWRPTNPASWTLRVYHDTGCVYIHIKLNWFQFSVSQWLFMHLQSDWQEFRRQDFNVKALQLHFGWTPMRTHLFGIVLCSSPAHIQQAEYFTQVIRRASWRGRAGSFGCREDFLA